MTPSEKLGEVYLLYGRLPFPPAFERVGGDKPCVVNGPFWSRPKDVPRSVSSNSGEGVPAALWAKPSALR